MPHVLFVFLDGVGLGPGGADNPLDTTLPAFEKMAGGHAWTQAAPGRDDPQHVFRPLDATLGVEGLPQSGTGQATLFTGVNGARAAGRHFGPFPHSKTKPLLDEKNVFLRVQQAGHTAAFANAYPPRFFTYARRKGRWTVTTHCCLAAGLRIRGMEDLRAGQALSADLTGRGLHRLGLEAPVITEEEAARRLLALSRRHTFTLFEYYLTDKAGHSRKHPRAARVLRSLDRFFGTLLDEIDPARELLVVTSDHGNLEDLSIKTHTRHPVPLVAYGRGASCLRTASDLTGVVPAVVDVLQSIA